MWKNYIKTSWRNITRQKGFTSLNIMGLAIGMSLNILILALVSQLMNFDEFHVNKDRIFRLLTVSEDALGKTIYASTFPTVVDELQDNYAGLEGVVRVNKNLLLHAIHHENEITIKGAYTDADFFDVFSFDLSQGNKKTALSKPNSLVISQNLAEKLFPGESALDKLISTKNRGDFTVTGILAENPNQTHLEFESYASHSTIDKGAQRPWSEHLSTYVYLLFNDDEVAPSFHSSLTHLANKVNSFNSNANYSFELQALSNITPGADVSNDLVRFDWFAIIWLFCLGLLILIPACFNYANLMIARAIRRSKEIGLRKVMGSLKSQIIYQFLVEALILTSIALTLSAFIIEVIRKEFLTMIEATHQLDLSLSFSMVGFFIAFGFGVGMMVGLFPAIYFSKVRILDALKGEINNRSVTISKIRKVLMVTQFTISLIFIIGVGVVIKQYHQILTYDKGFDEENRIVVPLKGIDHQLLTHKFETLSGVSDVCLTSHLPGLSKGEEISIFRTDNKLDSIQIEQIFVDDHFISSLGFETVWGSELRDSPSQSQEEFLVNEEFMRRMGLANSGHDSLNYLLEGTKSGKVTGVLRDFNFTPLYNPISPIIIRYDPDKTKYVILSVQSNDIRETIGLLQNAWESVNHQLPFESFFLDDRIEAAYDSLVTVVKIFTYLGFISIAVSIIGLLGMVVYLTEYRTKEIAIRKILGASVISLYYTIGGSFAKLLLLSIAISIPVSYFFYDKVMLPYLSQYTEGVGWIEMASSTLLVLLLGVSPLLWMVRQLSLLNPVVNLRVE